VGDEERVMDMDEYIGDVRDRRSNDTHGGLRT
jgi:hypothetical protein